MRTLTRETARRAEGNARKSAVGREGGIQSWWGGGSEILLCRVVTQGKYDEIVDNATTAVHNVQRSRHESSVYLPR